MLTINPSSLRASLGDAVAANGGNASGGAADPAGFASLLRQTQATPAPAPAPVPAASADATPTANEAPTSDAADTTEAPSESEPTSRARALLKSRLRAADGSAPARPAAKSTAPEATKAAQTDASDATVATTDAPEAKPAEPAIDPSVMHWLAGLQREVSGRTDDAPDAGGTTDMESADAGPTATGGAAKSARAADLKAEAELKDQAAQDKASLADAASTTRFAGVLAEQRAAEAPARPLVSAVGSIKDAAAATAGALAPAPTAGTEVAAPAAVPIAAPVTAPDFAQELGLRLSLLARDGVQQAELHLNPAEMGPVSVQIVMDGTQARVDFGADMAATRQAIEAGLPELASALRDAGFTLAGGGVSQHARGRGDGGDADASGRERGARSAVDSEVKRVATTARRIVTQGGIDLFA